MSLTEFAGVTFDCIFGYIFSYGHFISLSLSLSLSLSGLTQSSSIPLSHLSVTDKSVIQKAARLPAPSHFILRPV